MNSAKVVEIVTPKKVLLNGLWFGPKKPKYLVILVHGLTGSLFSMARLRGALEQHNTAVLTFNNRGFEQASGVRKLRGKKREWVSAGAGREIFRDCLDDVQGAVNFARKAGARNIYLAGHSTGAQKIVYWGSKTKNAGSVRGLILLGPLSDYVGTEKKYAEAISYARRLLRAGKPHELMPEKFGHWFPCDAQRFISLYSGKSVEEIFTYWDKSRNPKTLKAVKQPLLVVLAEKDEYADRPAKKIGDWFAEHLKLDDQIVVVPRVKHSFKGGERFVAKSIRRFIAK